MTLREVDDLAALDPRDLERRFWLAVTDRASTGPRVAALAVGYIRMILNCQLSVPQRVHEIAMELGVDTEADRLQTFVGCLLRLVRPHLPPLESDEELPPDA